jgi:hypothetical protein
LRRFPKAGKRGAPGGNEFHVNHKPPLDPWAGGAILIVMLQHNTEQAGQKAHVAHVAMLALHSLCCGLPVLAVSLAALSGASSGATAFAVSTGRLHGVLHAHEVWILAGSALLVGTGGVLEMASRKGGVARGFPWMFAVSVCCFALNFAIIAAHRAG